MKPEILLQCAAPSTTEIQLHCDAPLTLECAEGDDSLPKFSIRAYNGGAMRVSAFKLPVVVDLAGVEKGTSTPIIRSHDEDRIVGHATVDTSDGTMDAAGVVSADNGDSREFVTSARNGFPWQASIGGKVVRYETVRAGQSVSVNNQTFQGPLNVVREFRLTEISVLLSGADSQTRADMAARQPKGTDMDPEFTKWLQANGYETETFESLPEKAQKHLKATWKAESAGDEDPEDDPPKRPNDFQSLIASRKADRERQTEIMELADREMQARPDKLDEIEALAASALESGTSPRDFEVELIRGMRDAGPPNTPRGKNTRQQQQVMEAAVCKSLGVAEIEKHYSDEVLTAADQEFQHGIGLQQLLFRAAAAHGQHFDSAANVRALLKAAFADGNGIPLRAASGFSTFSLSGILSNAMGKMLRDYFNSVESTWRQITEVRPVRDFKQITSYSLTGDMEYQEIPPGGQIPHSELGETSYSNKAKSYGRLIAITREDIVNDDLGALQRVPQRMGRGAALAINRRFWTVFLDNSTFFSSGNSNVNTGSDSALALDDGGAAINAAEQVFFAQTDPDGQPMAVSPAIMLVPPSLFNTALQLMGSLNFVAGGGGNTTSIVPSTNVFASRYRVLMSRYMENVTYSGNSNAAWYLLASPMDVPVIQTVFLNGREMPMVESADADFDELGIRVRGVHDFGVALQEPRGGVRSAGS